MNFSNINDKNRSGFQRSMSQYHKYMTDVDSGRNQLPSIIGKKQNGTNRYKLVPISKQKQLNAQNNSSRLTKRIVNNSFQYRPNRFQTQIQQIKGSAQNKRDQLYNSKLDQFYNAKNNRRFFLQNPFQGPQTDFYMLKQGVYPKHNYRVFEQDKIKKPLWEEPPQMDIQNMSVTKKMYKIKKRMVTEMPKQLEDYEQDIRMPIIDKISIGKQKRQLYRQKDLTTIPPIYKYFPAQKCRRRYLSQYSYNHYYRTMKTYSSFRKVVHAILFTIYLRKYNQRMRKNRQYQFQKKIMPTVEQQLSKIKLDMIESLKPFFLMLIDQQNFDYKPSDKDDIVLKKQKINSIKKLIDIQAKCLNNCIKTLVHKQSTMELFYYLCKHGSYSCREAIYTAQQLSSGCISEAYGYMSCDNSLQKSLLLSLIFVKILLFNILLKPQNLQMFLDKIYDKKIIFKNIKLLGNILYEIMIDIQDNLLEQVSDTYIINNWQKNKNKFYISVAPSMTMKNDFIQKNQLISGLENYNLIRQIYGTKQMVEIKKMTEELLVILQKNLAKFHYKIRKPFF